MLSTLRSAASALPLVGADARRGETAGRRLDDAAQFHQFLRQRLVVRRRARPPGDHVGVEQAPVHRLAHDDPADTEAFAEHMLGGKNVARTVDARADFLAKLVQRSPVQSLYRLSSIVKSYV